MRRELLGEPHPGLPFSTALLSEGPLVWVSGQGPLQNGEYRPGSIEEETELTLRNLVRELERSATGLDRVLRVHVFLADLRHFAGMNEVYASWFPEPRPVRTTVGVQLLTGRIEIDCVALAGAQPGRPVR